MEMEAEPSIASGAELTVAVASPQLRSPSLLELAGTGPLILRLHWKILDRILGFVLNVQFVIENAYQQGSSVALGPLLDGEGSQRLFGLPLINVLLVCKHLANRGVYALYTHNNFHFSTLDALRRFGDAHIIWKFSPDGSPCYVTRAHLMVNIVCGPLNFYIDRALHPGLWEPEHNSILERIVNGQEAFTFMRRLTVLFGVSDWTDMMNLDLMINLLANFFSWPDNTITFRRMRVYGPRFISIVWVTQIEFPLQVRNVAGEFQWVGPHVMEVAFEGTLGEFVGEIGLEEIVREFFGDHGITFTVSVD